MTDSRTVRIADVLTEASGERADADPVAVRRKYRKMAAEPFAFYRGSRREPDGFRPGVRAAGAGGPPDVRRCIPGGKAANLLTRMLSDLHRRTVPAFL